MNQAIRLIAEFEGFESKAYKCPAGKWTIGFGDTTWKGKQVTALTKAITRAEAEYALQHRLIGFQRELDSMVTAPLTGNQNAALLSLMYNIGATALRRSTLLKMLNAGDHAGAAEQFLRWDKVAGKPMAGLTRRRKAERELFLKG